MLVEPIAAKTLWAGTLDPSLITALYDADIVQKIYAGLVKQVYDDKTKQFKIVPDLAAGMPTISKDGLVYTFKIRPDAKFSDGTPVTAQDFVHSFERVLDPKANSGANYYLFDIQGAEDYGQWQGQAPHRASRRSTPNPADHAAHPVVVLPLCADLRHGLSSSSQSCPSAPT